MPKRIQIIINPVAGRDRPILSTLNTAFHDADVDWDISITKAAGDAYRHAQAAVAAGVDVIGVYGGDGTITEAAGGLIGTDIPLAIFPGGTANAIAIAMGIPTDLAEAVAMALGPEAEIRRVDMGQIGERYFLIAVGIGLAGALAETADREAKDRLGPLAYALSSLEALRTSTVASYRMSIDGQEITRDGVTCVIANSGNFGVPGISLAPGIDMADGLLDVVVISDAGIGSLVSVAANMVRPDEKVQPFEHWKGREVHVVAEPLQAIQVDGEVLDPAPVRIKVLARAIRVIAPAKLA